MVDWKTYVLDTKIHTGSIHLDTSGIRLLKLSTTINKQILATHWTPWWVRRSSTTPWVVELQSCSERLPEKKIRIISATLEHWWIYPTFETKISLYLPKTISKISPTYPWKTPRTFHQQFMKEFVSLWGFGEVWGIFAGYVGKIIDDWSLRNYRIWASATNYFPTAELLVPGRVFFTHNIF